MRCIFIEQCPTPSEWGILRKSAGWSIATNANFKIAAQNSLYAISAYVNDEIVGMGRVIGDGILCFYIQDLVVAEIYQGHGVGGTILQLLLRYIRKHAAENAVIGLFASLNKEKFYKNYGFVCRPNPTKGCGMYIEPGMLKQFSLSQYPSYIEL